MVIGLLSSALFSALNQARAIVNGMPPEVREGLEVKPREYVCDKIPYGEHLIKTKMHLEEFLPLIIELKQLAKEILKRSHKLTLLSQDCKSSNCDGQCICVFPICVVLPCKLGSYPVCYHLSRIIEEHNKLVEAKRSFQRVYKKLLELEPALDDLLKENIKIANSFAVFYEQRETTSLYDCFRLMDMRIPTARIPDCPWDGNDYFHCK